MKNVLALAGVSSCVSGVTGSAQARPRKLDRRMAATRSVRAGKRSADVKGITKETVKDLQLLWKMKLENQPKGLRPLLPPLILGNLISYRGFKELAFVAASSDIIYSIDADLGKMFWAKHLEYASLDPALQPYG